MIQDCVYFLDHCVDQSYGATELWLAWVFARLYQGYEINISHGPRNIRLRSRWRVGADDGSFLNISVGNSSGTGGFLTAKLFIP